MPDMALLICTAPALCMQVRQRTRSLAAWLMSGAWALSMREWNSGSQVALMPAQNLCLDRVTAGCALEQQAVSGTSRGADTWSFG